MTRALLVAAAFVVLAAAPVYGQVATERPPAPPSLERTLAKIAAGAQLVACGADTAATMYGRGAGLTTEANPIMAPFQDHPVAFGSVMIGGCLAVVAVERHVAVKHPRAVAIAAAALAGVQFAIAIHNAQLLDAAPRRP